MLQAEARVWFRNYGPQQNTGAILLEVKNVERNFI